MVTQHALQLTRTINVIETILAWCPYLLQGLHFTLILHVIMYFTTSWVSIQT